MSEFDQIVDSISFRSRLSAIAAQPGSKAIQVVNSLFMAVDDQGRASPLFASAGDIFPGVDPTGVVDAAPAINAAITTAASVGGGTVWLPPGTIRCAARINMKTGVQMRGAGLGATTLLVDDSGGAIGDFIVLDHIFASGVFELKVGATAMRTGGAAIKVISGSTVTTIGTATVALHRFSRIWFDHQFDGFVIYDDNSIAGAGAWDVRADHFYFSRSNGAGSPIWLNSPQGGTHTLTDMFNIGDVAVYPPTQAPIAGCRVSGSLDFTLTRISSVICQHGLLFDPPSGQKVEAGIVTDCEWDSNVNGNGIFFNPASGALACHQVRLINNWSSTNANNFAVSGAVAPVDAIHVIGGCMYTPSGYGVIVNGAEATNVTFDGVEVSGVANTNDAAFWFTGSCLDFAVRGCFMGTAYSVVTANALKIDAGCDGYIITGNNARHVTGTALNEPTPGAHRVLTANLGF